MSKRVWWFLSCVVVVVALDQYTKFLTLERLTYAFDGVDSRLRVFFSSAPESSGAYHFAPKTDVVFSDNFFKFRYAENPGAAFGLFRTVPDNLRGPLFHLVSIGAVILLISFMRKLKGAPNEKWAVFGLPLVLGGALGNYVDRLARGFVIDFLEAHYYEKAYWPAFNIADTAICIGVGALLIDSLVRKESKS
jgi:signal peptidase II